MQNVVFDAEIAKDPRFDTELGAVIAEYKTSVEEAEEKAENGLKSTPLTKLIKERKLTVDFLKAEFPKIAAKSSSLPSSQRTLIANVIFTAARRTVLLKQAERARKIEEKANARVAGEEVEAPKEPKPKGSKRKLKKLAKAKKK